MPTSGCQIAALPAHALWHYATAVAHLPLWQRYRFDARRCLTLLLAAEQRGDVLLGATNAAGMPLGLCWGQLRGAMGRGYVRLLAAWQPQTGVGGQLLQHFEAAVQQQQIGGVFLLVNANNHAAAQFYAHCGYCQVGLLNDFIAAGEDETIWYKPLALRPK